MSTTDIYRDIATRTGGSVYVGCVGPVRTGKSTFIKRFMDTLVIPHIEDGFKRERATDELPQSAAGRTIMTTQPRFVPDEAVEVRLKDAATARVRLVDCVGYLIPGVLGLNEGEAARMVRTPWYDHDIPFEEMIATHWHVAEIPFTNQQITAEKALPYSEMLIKEILNRPRNTHAMQLVSPNEWNAYVVEKFNMALYAHARILNATGRTKESMKYMEMVYPYYSKKAEYADLYVKLLNQLGRQEEVIPYIKQCVPEDATTQEMLDLLKSDYLTNNPNGDFDQFLASLKNAEQIEKDRAKAIAELIDLPVTLFTLDRMGGGKVNLADKKGKIIFLDFWATWCAPCKASMPGGQMTVNRWKDNKDVEFYFIDTQETKADYRKTAEAFIKSKDFTFTVLYDNGEVGKQDEQYKSVASVLHTSGIPLKVILDRRGHIRWMGSGYHGSPTQMADEISYILEYLLNE